MQPPEYWAKAKEDAWNRDHAWEIGFALKEDHPYKTGEKKCWYCKKDDTEASMKFDVELRLGDWAFLPPEVMEEKRKKGEKVPNVVSECSFCDLQCYMKGWPAVRRDFILGGGRAPEKGEETSGAA